MRTSSPPDAKTPAAMAEKFGATMLFVCVAAVSFLYLDARNASVAGTLSTLSLRTRFDAYVPFVPEFVFAYVLYYPWALLPMFVLRDRESFFRALGAFMLMQVIATAVFIVWPSHMQRPEVTQPGFTNDVVRMIYGSDLGWNVFPSLHVGHSLLVALLYYQHERRFFAPVAVGSVLIMLSTVFIKQHYVIDVPAGLVLGWFCYRVTCLPLPAAGGFTLVPRALRANPLVRHLASRSGDKHDSLR